MQQLHWTMCFSKCNNTFRSETTSLDVLLLFSHRHDDQCKLIWMISTNILLIKYNPPIDNWSNALLYYYCNVGWGIPVIKMVLSTHTSILSTLVSTPYKSPFAPRFAAQHKPLSGHWMWTLEQNLITKFGHQAAERCVNIKPNLVTLQQTPQGDLIADLFSSFSSSSSSFCLLLTCGAIWKVWDKSSPIHSCGSSAQALLDNFCNHPTFRPKDCAIAPQTHFWNF